MTDMERQSLRFVLDGLTFPAQRWEIITTADLYGADAATTDRLRRLPSRNRPYRDLRDIVTTLDDMAA